MRVQPTGIEAFAQVDTEQGAPGSAAWAQNAVIVSLQAHNGLSKQVAGPLSESLPDKLRQQSCSNPAKHKLPSYKISLTLQTRSYLVKLCNLSHTSGSTQINRHHVCEYTINDRAGVLSTPIKLTGDATNTTRIFQSFYIENKDVGQKGASEDWRSMSGP